MDFLSNDKFDLLYYSIEAKNHHHTQSTHTPNYFHTLFAPLASAINSRLLAKTGREALRLKSTKLYGSS